MRCYFLHGGHIDDIEILPSGLSDKDAIARAHLLKRTGVNSGATGRRIHGLWTGFGWEQRGRGYRAVTSFEKDCSRRF